MCPSLVFGVVYVFWHILDADTSCYDALVLLRLPLSSTYTSGNLGMLPPSGGVLSCLEDTDGFCERLQMVIFCSLLTRP